MTKLLLLIVLALAGTLPASGSTRGVRTNAPSVLDMAAIGVNDTLQGRTKDRFSKPLGQLTDTTRDSCFWAAVMAQNYSGHSKWQIAYDTIRWFFNHCYEAAGPGPTDGLSGDWQDIFGGIEDNYLKQEPVDTALAMRKWLLSIRNIVPNGEWWCDVVEAIWGTYTNTFDRLAIVKFLIDNPHCPDRAVFFNREYRGMMSGAFSDWADTDPHPNTDTFDSTLPSLHDLGLDSLLHDVASGVETSASGSQILLSAHITANPFAERTSLALRTSREAWFKISVYDVLGRAVDGAGYSGVLEPGSRTIPLVLTNAPPGTYYVRIATANDEVLTLKLTKE